MNTDAPLVGTPVILAKTLAAVADHLGLPMEGLSLKQIVDRIDQLRSDHERIESGEILVNHPPDEWGKTKTHFKEVDLRRAIDDARSASQS